MSTIGALSGLMLLVAPIQEDQPAEPEPLQCMAGPIHRTFGGTEWLAYGCSDHATLIVVSALGNPAKTLVFTLSKTDSGVRIRGKGNSDQLLSAAEDLQNLSSEDLDQMLREAEAHP